MRPRNGHVVAVQTAPRPFQPYEQHLFLSFLLVPLISQGICEVSSQKRCHSHWFGSHWKVGNRPPEGSFLPSSSEEYLPCMQLFLSLKPVTISSASLNVKIFLGLFLPTNFMENSHSTTRHSHVSLRVLYPYLSSVFWCIRISMARFLCNVIHWLRYIAFLIIPQIGAPVIS